jgi:cyclopropane-fatty-acyl-phospholipid synthase
MITTTPSLDTRGALAKPSLVLGALKRIVFDTLAKLPIGRLEVHDEDGALHTFGRGDAPRASLTIKSEGFYKRIVMFGDIGFGDAYVDGDWESDDVPGVISWFIANIDHAPLLSGGGGSAPLLSLLGVTNQLANWMRPNSLEGSRKNIHAHYDLSNELFETFLDQSMAYSAAYFQYPGQSLAAAQEAKFDALLRRLNLKPTDHLLEIGCGWGGLAIHAAKHYGCQVTAVTISEKQFLYARERVRAAGLEDRITLRLEDYRNLTGQYDRIASVEMVEAVGHAYHETYFSQVARLLKPDGLFAMQAILAADHRYESLRKNVDWIQKHIFPGSLLLSVERVQRCLAGGMMIAESEDLGLDYAKTLQIWRERFNASLPRVKSLGFDERFIRSWNYYLDYCMAGFATRHITVTQFLFSRANNPNLVPARLRMPAALETV